MPLAQPKKDMDPQLVDTQPASVAAWLERLPYTSLPECGQLLSDALHQLARTPLAADKRYKLLKLYLAALDRYYPLLEQDLCHNDALGSAKSRQLATLGVKLFGHLFVAFKQALGERMARRGLFERKQTRIELLAYCLLAARQFLSLSQQSYTPLPAGFWLDCHQLFALARAHGWEDKRLGRDDALAALYRQLLLLGLTASNRLSQGELRLTRRLACELAGQIRLLPVAGVLAGVSGYMLDLNADTPPLFLPINPRQLGPDCFLLDLGTVLETIGKSLEQLQKAQNANPQPQLGDEMQLLSALSEDWTRPRRRRQPREKTQGIVEVCAGLAAVWHRLNGQRWALGERRDCQQPRTPPPPCLMLVADRSETGFLLRGQPREQVLRAGELVLINGAETDDQPLLCVARWIVLRGNGQEIECGLEILSREPLPALAMPSITHSGDSFQHALLLPGQQKPYAPPQLLLNGRGFSQLREFHLRDAAGEQLVRVTRLTLQSAHFQLMEYRDSDQF